MLYRMFAPEMFAVCLRYAPDRESAKDFLQDAFLKIFDKIDDYRSDGSFAGWARRIAVTTALERLRRDRKLDFIPAYDSSSYDESTCSGVLSKLSSDEILKIISDMPEGYRTVMNLYSIEGYSHAEISELLGISEEGSRSQLSRAKKYLQDRLKKIGLTDGQV